MLRAHDPTRSTAVHSLLSVVTYHQGPIKSVAALASSNSLAANNV